MVLGSECLAMDSRYSSELIGGFFKPIRNRLIAVQTIDGERSKRWHKKSSGCCASIPYSLNDLSGKSLKLYVTMIEDDERIAAANTCLSFGSGNESAGMSVLYPSTRQSRTFSFISCRVRSS